MHFLRYQNRPGGVLIKECFSAVLCVALRSLRLRLFQRRGRGGTQRTAEKRLMTLLKAPTRDSLRIAWYAYMYVSALECRRSSSTARGTHQSGKRREGS